MAQPTLDEVQNAIDSADAARKKLVQAEREANRAQARANELILSFCRANGIPIIAVERTSNND